MSLKKVETEIETLLNGMLLDLEKAKKGNMSAAQRVRTQSLDFSKLSKDYRRLSMDVVRKAKRLPKRKSRSSC